MHIGDSYWLNVLKILKWLQPYSINVTEIKLFGQRQRTKKKNTEEPVPQIDLMQSKYYPALEKIGIGSASENFLFSILDFRSQPNNILSLSLHICHLSIDSTSALMHYLQSPHCVFHEVLMYECTISMHTDTKKKEICYLESLKFQTSEKKSLVVRGLNRSTMSHLILWFFFVTKLSDKSDFQGRSLEENSMTDIAESFAGLSSQHNNLIQSLSLIECVLSWESFICLLQSPNCQLQELELDDKCKISNAKGTNKTPCELKLELKTASKFSLYISSSSHVIDRLLLSQPHFYTSALAELKIENNYPGTIKFRTRFPVLETLEIKGEDTFPFNYKKNTSLFPSFLSFEENNLSILSLKECILNREATMLLIQFLQSPYCRLHHVSLFWCEISFTHKTKHSGGLELLLEDAEKASLTVFGTDHLISYFLSKLHFYGSTLNRLVL